MLADLTLVQLQNWIAFWKVEPFCNDDMQWGLTRAMILTAAGAKGVNPTHQTVAHLLTEEAAAVDPLSAEAFDRAARGG